MKKYNLLFFFITMTFLGVVSSYFLTFMVFPKANAQNGPSKDKTVEKMPEDLIEAKPGKSPDSKPLEDLKPIEGSKDSKNSDLIPKFEEFVYDSRGKRDPFQPFKAFLENSGNGTSKDKASAFPLTKFTLESLSVVAIMWDTNNPRAMIKAPDNSFHTVGKKTLIGRNNGYVAAIREGELVVIEKYYSDGQSRLQTKLLELTK